MDGIVDRILGQYLTESADLYRTDASPLVSYAQSVAQVAYQVGLLIKKYSIHNIQQLKTRRAFILIKWSWIFAAKPECAVRFALQQSGQRGLPTVR
jgi:hypothetical protein